MTAITGIDTTTTGSNVAKSSPVQILGKDDFLNLLVTQLQNQDPLNPADSTEFTAQLAQFSSLEQLSNINDNLENMEQFQTSVANSQAVSYIGKQITAYGNSVQLSGGLPVQCSFELEDNASLAVVTIYDASGGFVKSFETGALESGRQTAAWDGTDSYGKPVSAGLYRFEIQAIDADNQHVGATPLISSIVTGVSLKDNAARLITELQTVGIDDVIDISEPAALSGTDATYSSTNDINPLNGGQ